MHNPSAKTPTSPSSSCIGWHPTIASGIPGLARQMLWSMLAIARASGKAGRSLVHSRGARLAPRLAQWEQPLCAATPPAQGGLRGRMRFHNANPSSGLPGSPATKYILRCESWLSLVQPAPLAVPSFSLRDGPAEPVLCWLAISLQRRRIRGRHAGQPRALHQRARCRLECVHHQFLQSEGSPLPQRGKMQKGSESHRFSCKS